MRRASGPSLWRRRRLRCWIATTAVRQRGKSPPLVKTLIGRKTTLPITQMPFAVMGGLVACIQEEFGERVFPGGHAFRQPTDGNLRGATAHRRRPVKNAERDGVHSGSTLKFVSCNPSPAKASMRGVGARRIAPPPNAPISP